jgi:2-methylcitrate dehydratase PrpD
MSAVRPAPAAHAQRASGLTLELARRSCALTYEELPDDVAELARQCLLDWFAVTLGGCREPGPAMLVEVLAASEPAGAPSAGEREGNAGPADAGARAGARPGAGAASIVGRRERVAPLAAALINGTASHVLDFDDVNLGFLGHASVAVGAAVLALGEQLDAGAHELLTAFVAGYETTCRVAAALGPRPYVRGFHATGTIGTFGAAAGCSRLLELEPARTAIAFGIAASQAAGAKANFGTMTKSLHAGKACENGLLAALLAARGFTARPDAIEAEQGFAALAGGDCDTAAALADPARGWHIRGNLFKHHAACFFTHSTLEGLGRLRRSPGLRAQDVQEVTLHVGELELGACAIAEPATALEVKFSLAHLAAMALLDRDTAAIHERDAHDPDTLALRARVRLADDAQPGAPTLVEVALRDGALLSAAVDVSAPEPDLALQARRLARKFLALGEPVLGADRAADLLRAVEGLDSRAGARALMSLARPHSER